MRRTHFALFLDSDHLFGGSVLRKVLAAAVVCSVGVAAGCEGGCVGAEDEVGAQTLAAGGLGLAEETDGLRQLAQQRHHRRRRGGHRHRLHVLLQTLLGRGHDWEKGKRERETAKEEGR